MNGSGPSDSFFIGWDVGGWNCDHNANSRDALVILNSELVIMGNPWRGNLRDSIIKSANTKEFIRQMFSQCAANLASNTTRVTLAIDTPLGFSSEFVGLVTGLRYVEMVECFDTNPYLFRQTERRLFELGIHPLSAVKDMIGSQATKGMHVLAKFAPTVERCGVWSDGEWLTTIEAYPAACKNSKSIEALRHQVRNQPSHNQDEMDALTCALVAYLFATDPEQLAAPSDSVPASEGWIWVPKDISPGRPPFQEAQS